MDLENLRRQYASMTDEALLEINSGELVDAAYEVLKQELRSRGLQPAEREDHQASESEFDLPEGSSDVPDWLEEAVTVYSEMIGRNDQARMREAVAILVGSGIGCYTKVSEDTDGAGARRSSCDLLVPFNQQLQAVSILDKKLFNAQHEADWKGHFQTMTDDELLALDEDALVAGLRDRADRLIRAWEDELLKRGLAELESGD
jgi:hypothetical protein